MLVQILIVIGGQIYSHFTAQILDEMDRSFKMLSQTIILFLIHV
jgi:hypothetical protein